MTVGPSGFACYGTDLYRYMVESGQFFDGMVQVTSLAALSIYDILIRTGAKALHIPGAMVTTTAAISAMTLIEGPTGVTGGDTMTMWNRNRTSTKTLGVTIKTAVTGATGGVSIPREPIMMATAGTPTKRDPSKTGGTVEWVLKPNTDYVFRMVVGADAATFIVEFYAYEDPE